jgi:hypothetical protein
MKDEFSFSAALGVAHVKKTMKSPMRLKDVQKAILNNPDDKDIAFLLGFYHQELVVSNSCDFRTIDALFDWATEQEPGKIGLYAGVALLRGFFHMKDIISKWAAFRDVFNSWLIATNQDADKILAGLFTDKPYVPSIFSFIDGINTEK